MPSTSEAQARLMRAVAHGWHKPGGGGPSVSVAKEFVAADKAKAAMNTVRKYAEGGDVDEWENVPRTPEGIPQITVTKPIESELNPFETAAQRPTQRVAPRPNYGSGLATVGEAVGNDLYRQATIPMRMWEEAKRPYSLEGEQTDYDPTAGDVTGEAVGSTILNMFGPTPPKGAIASGSLAAMARPSRASTRTAADQARDKLMLGHMDSTAVPPQLMARHLATANRNDPSDMADDLYRIWEADPKHGDAILSNIPGDIRSKVDHFLDQRIRASDESLQHWPNYESIGDKPPVDYNNYVPMDLPKEQTKWAEAYRNILPASGISEPTGDFLSAYVLPHFNSNFKDFTNRYFGGMYNPEKFSFGPTFDGHGIRMRGELKDPITAVSMMVDHPMGGNKVPATIDRSIVSDPDTGLKYAYHNYFALPKERQGAGIAKSVLRDQVDLYKKMDLDYIKLTANVDVGSYAWGKYGFLPHTDQQWQSLAKYLKNGLDQLASFGRMPENEHRYLSLILKNPDRHALWDFADAPGKIPIGILGSNPKKQLKWSQKLLLDTPWEGKLDLKDPESMRKFNDYISQRK